jgi:hypothetical protein
MKSKLILMIMLTCFKLSADAKTDSLTTKILKADKVEILSHEDSYLFIDSNGKLNESIVTERLELSKIGVDRLLNIINKRYPQEMPASRASCFDPHQAIALFKNGLYSIIDICFGCQQFSPTTDILLSENFLSTDTNWMDLKNFFISNGIKKKIE